MNCRKMLILQFQWRKTEWIGLKLKSLFKYTSVENKRIADEKSWWLSVPCTIMLGLTLHLLLLQEQRTEMPVHIQIHSIIIIIIIYAQEYEQRESSLLDFFYYDHDYVWLDLHQLLCGYVHCVTHQGEEEGLELELGTSSFDSSSSWAELFHEILNKYK